MGIAQRKLRQPYTRQISIMLGIEKKRLRKALVAGFIKENTARSIMAPIATIALIAALCLPNKLSFAKINRIFEDKKGVMYYEMERGDVIESAKPLETFGKGSDAYLKTEAFGEGKTVILFIAVVFFGAAAVSFFAEGLESRKIFKKAIRADLKKRTVENPRGETKEIWTAYSKEIGQGYHSREGLDLPESMAELESLPDAIDKPEMRNKKLEELGIR